MIARQNADFGTPAGTRGLRPPSLFGRWFDRQGARLGGTRIGLTVYRTLMRCDSLVLITIGRKSGTERRHRVACFPGDDGSWLIVASAGGTAGNPAWYYNMAAHPDRVEVDADGREVAVTPRQLRGSERAEAWRQITATSPQFARFQQKTDRELPVIRLMPRVGELAPRRAHALLLLMVTMIIADDLLDFRSPPGTQVRRGPLGQPKQVCR